MTVAVVGTEATSWGSASASLTIPAGATGMVLCFQQSDDSGPQPASSMKVGSGTAMTKVAYDESSGTVTQGGSIWWCDDIRGRDTDVVTWTADGGGGGGTVGAVYFSALGPLLRDVNPYKSTGFGLSGSSTEYQSSDASVPVTGGNQLAIIERFQYGSGANNVIVSGTEVFGNGASTLVGYDIGAADEAVDVGAYAEGQFWGWTLGLTIYESVVVPDASPDPLTPVLAFQTGAIALTGPVEIQTNPLRQLLFHFRPGKLGSQAKRQVALVGPDAQYHRFTPEMTVGGAEGDVLVQHVDEPPTWEDRGSLALKRWREPVRFDSDADGVADEWLFDDNGDIVMIEKVGS